MKHLMRPEAPQNHKDVAELKAPRVYTKGWKPPPVIEALLRSQAKQADLLENSTRAHRRLRTTPKIPQTNILGKPLSPRRFKNMTKRWYADVVDRLLPPLPEVEWNELHLFATGKATWNGPVPRRKMLHNEDEGLADVTGRSLLERPVKGHTFRPYVGGSPHKVTPRFMRKMWRSILEQVPRKVWKADDPAWSFQWNALRAPRMITATASSKQIVSLFDGMMNANEPSAQG